MSSFLAPHAVTTSERPLRILQVGSHFSGWGGAEIHVLNVAEDLMRRGHQVCVSCRPGRFVEARSKERGLPVFPATVKRQRDWRSAIRYFLYLRREKFDIVHAHWRDDYIVPLTMARLAQVPVRLISHHSPTPLTPNEVDSLSKRLTNRIIALSESVRGMLIGCGIPANHVVTIHHGTDTEAFRETTLSPTAVRAEWGIPDNRLVVGLVGRIAPEKGHTVFMDAVAQAIRQGANVHAVMVGDGRDAQAARSRALEPDLVGRVTFAGFRSDVNNAMNALDVFVLASTWAEPCAAVVQQAMALGKPVIGTNTGGTPEMVAAGETGLLVAAGDANALAKAIQRLQAMPAVDRAAMGNKGRERVERLFTQSIMVDKIEQLYRAEIAQKRTGK